MICQCGWEAKTITYVNGKKTCSYCKPRSLSGQFDRRMNQDRQHFAKDILQKFNKDGSINNNFKEVYGEGRNVK